METAYIFNHMAQWNLFDVVNSVILKFPAAIFVTICNFPLFSHSKNIRMSTLMTIIITYQLLIINYYNNNYKKSQ